MPSKSIIVTLTPAQARLLLRLPELVAPGGEWPLIAERIAAKVALALGVTSPRHG